MIHPGKLHQLKCLTGNNKIHFKIHLPLYHLTQLGMEVHHAGTIDLEDQVPLM
jgi:hypothetical protein